MEPAANGGEVSRGDCRRALTRRRSALRVGYTTILRRQWLSALSHFDRARPNVQRAVPARGDGLLAGWAHEHCSSSTKRKRRTDRAHAIRAPKSETVRRASRACCFSPISALKPTRCATTSRRRPFAVRSRDTPVSGDARFVRIIDQEARGVAMRRDLSLAIVSVFCATAGSTRAAKRRSADPRTRLGDVTVTKGRNPCRLTANEFV